MGGFWLKILAKNLLSRGLMASARPVWCPDLDFGGLTWHTWHVVSFYCLCQPCLWHIKQEICEIKNSKNWILEFEFEFKFENSKKKSIKNSGESTPKIVSSLSNWKPGCSQVTRAGQIKFRLQSQFRRGGTSESVSGHGCQFQEKDDGRGLHEDPGGEQRPTSNSPAQKSFSEGTVIQHSREVRMGGTS